MHIKRWLFGFALISALGTWHAAQVAPVQAKSDPPHWVGTFSAGLVAWDQPLDGSNQGFQNRTLRQILHVSIGGSWLRLRLSNAHGAKPLVVGSTHLALQKSGASIVPGSDRALTFGGQATITIPVGAWVVSDPIRLDVAPLSNVAVSLYVPNDTGPATWQLPSLQTSYVSPAGDFTGTPELPVEKTDPGRYWVSGLEVLAPPVVSAIVAVGDSLTHGFGSTPDTNQRWPDLLSARLNARPWRLNRGVLNQGIGANRLLHEFSGNSAAARFDRDVIAQSGVSHVILSEGVVDLGLPGVTGATEEQVSAAQMIQGFRQLIEKGRSRGLKMLGATLTPFEGVAFPGFHSAEIEAKRQAINQWIRNGGAFDGVLDFDAVVRDPSAPTRLLPAYDSGDHIHLNNAGYTAEANSIDLGLFAP
ncbi:MAG TPA: SGNH/GDSL hydrolase family protein [Polyangiaceae bacterium]|nr:SGNH/GDSL hydrolase family protein [Polyangiaceae bacterium]